MQTLTITAAKKNLGKWLRAAAQGQDVGIVSGSDIIALRKVPVVSADYAQREYGVTEAELERFAQAADALVQHHRAAGDLERHRVNPRHILEKTTHRSSRRPGKSRHAS